MRFVLGTIIGETIGYALTAVWMVLVALGLRKKLLGNVLAVAGVIAAVLIATGVVEPLDVPGTGGTNFAGYVLWSLWLIAVAVRVLLAGRRSVQWQAAAWVA